MKDNFLNKSELIRESYSLNPAATNRQIMSDVKRRHGVSVRSNLIIQAIGKERDRKALVAYRPTILAAAKTLLDVCGRDLASAQHHLRMVS